MGDGVSPRRRSAVCPEELPEFRPQLHVKPILPRLPLDGAVGCGGGGGLEDLFSGSAEDEGLVGGGEVLAEAALEADDVGFSGDELHRPADVGGGAVAGLADGILVVGGLEVLGEMALEANNFGATEKLHNLRHQANFGGLREQEFQEEFQEEEWIWERFLIVEN